MPEFEHEKRLHELRDEAWDAFRKGLISGADASQLFSRAIEAYDREVRVHLAVDEESDRDYAAEMRTISEARDIAYEVLDELDPERPMAGRMRALIAKLDRVLGPDLVREADPTGKVLKSLPYDERKRILDAAGLPMVADPLAVDSERGPFVPILIMEDEAGPIFEKARKERERREAAERLSDYLTQLGIDPDETFEGDARTTAQILVDIVRGES